MEERAQEGFDQEGCDPEGFDIERGYSRGDSPGEIRGDLENELYNQSFKPTVKMLRNRGHTLEQAQDLAHDAYFLVVRKLRENRLVHSGELCSYVLGVAKKLASGERRKALRRERLSKMYLVQNYDQDVDTPDQERDDMVAIAHSVLSRLTQDRDRDLLSLAFLFDWDKARICDSLSLEGPNYDRVKHRALMRCRQIVSESADLRHHFIE